MAKRSLHSLCRAHAIAAIAAAALVGVAHSGDLVPGADSGYLRYLAAGPDADEEERRDRLQTAVARFRSGDDLVDLVAAVHLGDADYFAALDALLDGYDRVLYEMVGGAVGDPDDDALSEDGGASAAGAGPDPLLGAVGGLQQSAKRWLGLEFQLDAIDYRRPHFVHADLTWEEYARLSAQSGQGIATLFERMLALAEEEDFSTGLGLPASDLGSLLLMARAASAVSQGDTAGLKRLLAPVLAGSGEWLRRLEGEDGTLIVGERNRVAMERLAEERARRPGPGRYAIFYGAGHMPDLESRLLAEGFALEGTNWIDAWVIPRTPPSRAEAAADELLDSPADAAQRFLDANPGLLDAARELGTALQRLQEAAR